MKRLALVLALASLTACAGAPTPAPREALRAPVADAKGEVCDEGDPLPLGLPERDDAPLRPTGSAPPPPLAPALLAQPLTAPTFDPEKQLADLSAEPPRLASLGPLTRIVIKGNVRVAEAAIRAALRTGVGELPTTKTVRRDVRELYASGLFDDVEVRSRSEGAEVELTFLVHELLPRGELFFSGAETLPQGTLREVAELAALPTKQNVFSAAERVRARYVDEGRRLAEVSARTRARKDRLDVCLRVSEGPLVRIAHLVFQGNQVLRDADLRAVIHSDAGKVNVEGGVYRDEAFRVDQARMLGLYYDSGHIQADVKEPELTPSDDQTRLTVTTRIQEGPVFHIGSLAVTGDLVAEPARYAALFQVKTGEIFSRSRILEEMERIRTLHRDAGQPFIEVTPETTLDPANHTVDLTFRITRQKVVP